MPPGHRLKRLESREKGKEQTGLIKNVRVTSNECGAVRLGERIVHTKVGD